MLEIYGQTLEAESRAAAAQHWFAGRGCAHERGKFVAISRPENGKTIARRALQLTRNEAANPCTTS